jgi:hypothetical protein
MPRNPFDPIKLPKPTRTPLTKEQTAALNAEGRLQFGHMVIGIEWDHIDRSSGVVDGWPVAMLEQSIRTVEFPLFDVKVVPEPMKQPITKAFFLTRDYGDIR